MVGKMGRRGGKRRTEREKRTGDRIFASFVGAVPYTVHFPGSGRVSLGCGGSMKRNHIGG